MTFGYFFVIPGVFALLQYLVTRSKRIARGRKYIPLALVGGIAALTWSAAFGWISLPFTYWIDQSSFFPLPDFAYVGLWCIPAVVGLAFGAIAGVAVPGKEETP